jgi:L-ribulose-5-phosphate 4-epimerase
MILEEKRKTVIKVALEVAKMNLITLTFGNLSIKDKESGYICITPSGIDYDELSPEDIVIVDVQGNVVDGNKKPSTELSMHCEIYKSREDIFSVIHTHSTMATSWACCGMDIPCISSELCSTIGGPIMCVPYKTQETKELGMAVASALKEHDAVLLENHGTVSVGKSIKEAFVNSLMVEESAKKAFYAKQIGILNVIPEDECRCIKRKVRDNYGQ